MTALAASPTGWFSAQFALVQIVQVTLVAIAVALIVRLFCRHRPHLSYLLWMLVLVKALTPPVWASPTGVFSWAAAGAVAPKAPLPRAPTNSPNAATVDLSPVEASAQVAMRAAQLAQLPVGRQDSESARSIDAIAVARFIWFVGAALFFVVMLWRQRAFARNVALSAKPADADLVNHLDRLAAQLGVRARPRLVVTSLPLGPAAFGLWRPMIVLPESLVLTASTEMLAAVMGHELVHLRRHDPLAAAIQLAAQAAWWFHPLIGWANREVRRERELACDEEVVASLALSPAGYARTLVAIVEARLQSRPALGWLAVSGAEVTARRIEHVVRRGERLAARTPRWCWLVFLAAALVTLPGAGLTRTVASAEKLTADESADGLDVNGGDGITETPALDDRPATADANGNSALQETPENRAAVDKLARRRIGVHVFTEQQPHGPTPPYVSVQLDAGWDGNVADLDLLQDLVALKMLHLDLNRVKAPQADVLAKLADLRELERLLLVGVNDEGMREVGELTQLRALMIHDSDQPRLTDAGLKSISSLANLHTLHLIGVRFSDKGLAALAELRVLERLTIFTTEHIPIDAAWLSPLAHLTELHLSGIAPTSNGIARIAALPMLNSLTLRARDLDDTQLQRLGGMAQLKSLRIVSAERLTAAGLASIGRLQQLRWLSLHGPKVTDADLEAWSGNTDLLALELSSCEIGDAGFSALGRLTKLRLLALHGEVNVTDAGFANLAALTDLRQLSLPAPKVTDASMAALAPLVKLKVLSLLKSRITDAGLTHLAGATGLTELSLASESLTGTGFAQLVGLKQLRLLSARSGITNEGLGAIAKLTTLEDLSLSSSHVDDAGLALLEPLVNLRRLALFNSSNVTDAALDTLVQFPRLGSLQIAGTKMTEEAVARRLPRTEGTLGLTGTFTRYEQVEREVLADEKPDAVPSQPEGERRDSPASNKPQVKEQSSRVDGNTTALAINAARQERKNASSRLASQMAELTVRVVDGDGTPVPKAKVSPWALRSSQGHGLWAKDDQRAEIGPSDAFTDAAGTATVLYPYYRDRGEGIRTISVSLRVDHPEFAYIGDLHINVPLETGGPYVVRLTAGIPLELRPLLDGESANLDNVFVLWSDGRSSQPGSTPQKLADGALRIPAMPPGENSVLLVKLDGERATHFSKITDFKLVPGEPKRLDVSLLPGVRVRGVLSDNVPRPVRNGRVKARTLDPADAANYRVGWWTWTPIQPDGTFTIEGWPADEPIQLIALCDGFLATSGSAPDRVKNPRDPKTDPFTRPQVFSPNGDMRIELAMTPLVRCVVKVMDEDERPIAGVSVESWPNVGWWNFGSQVYCHPLARGERFLRERDYNHSIDEVFPHPFKAETDAKGHATLALPTGGESLTVLSEVYELPVLLGRREIRVNPARGETTKIRLQPRSTEKLGEWDQLAGVVFGCSTREGRRIGTLPGVQKQMERIVARFREAKFQRDAQLLSEAYSIFADAFVGVGDLEEAAKWRQKAAEQAEKAREAGQATDGKAKSE